MAAFFQRVKKSFAGVLIGVLLIPGSIVLHCWNEYRTIHRSRGLAEAAAVVQSIPDPTLLADNLNGKLVHVAGRAETPEVLVDDTFGVRENAIHLARRVEMYQWDETEKSSSENQTKEYSYNKKWVSGRVNSESFHSAGHDNPQMKYPPNALTADHVKIGLYELNEPLKKNISSWVPIELNEASIFETVGTELSEQFLIRDAYVYWSSSRPDPDSPEVGDLRIQFEKVPQGDVSLIAMLNANSFKEYSTSNGEKIQRLFSGLLTSEEIMQRLMTENTILAWAIRFAGVVVCVVGFSLVLGPISALVSWIPILGDLTGFAVFVVAALLAVVVSLTTISLSWIAVRPLLGIALLMLAALAGYAIFRMRKRPGSEPQIIDASMVVP